MGIIQDVKNFTYRTFISDPVSLWTDKPEAEVKPSDAVIVYVAAATWPAWMILGAGGCGKNVPAGCTNDGIKAGSLTRVPNEGTAIPLGTPSLFQLNGVDTTCGVPAEKLEVSCKFYDDAPIAFKPVNGTWQAYYTVTKEDYRTAYDPVLCQVLHKDFPTKDHIKYINGTVGEFDNTKPVTPTIEIPDKRVNQYAIETDKAVTFETSCVEDKETSCLWFFASSQNPKDPNTDKPDATGRSVTRSWSTTGNYTVMVRALKSDGFYTDSSTMNLTVTNDNRALSPVPVTITHLYDADACRTEVEISIDPTDLIYTDDVFPVSDPENIFLHWTVDGVVHQGPLSDPAVTSFVEVFKTSGSKAIELKAKHISSSNWTVVYSNKDALYVHDKGADPVTINLPDKPKVGQTVTYTANPVAGSDPNRLSYRWAFSDGTTYPTNSTYVKAAQESSVDHIWLTAGNKTVTLYVVDDFADNDLACADYTYKITTPAHNVDANYICDPALVWHDEPKVHFSNQDGSANIYECVTSVRLEGSYSRRIYDPKSGGCVDDPSPAGLVPCISWSGNIDGDKNQECLTSNSAQLTSDPQGGTRFSINHTFKAPTDRGSATVESRISDYDAKTGMLKNQSKIATTSLPFIGQGVPNLPNSLSLVIEGGRQYERVAGETLTLRPDLKIPGATYTWLINGKQWTPSAADLQIDPDGAIVNYIVPSDSTTTQVRVQLIVDFPVVPTGEANACYAMRIKSNELPIPVNPCALRIDSMMVTPGGNATLGAAGHPEIGDTITLTAVNPGTCSGASADPATRVKWVLGGPTDLDPSGVVTGTLADVGTLNVKYYQRVTKASLWQISDGQPDRLLGTIDLPYLKNAADPSVTIKAQTTTYDNETTKFSADVPNAPAGRYQFSWDFQDGSAPVVGAAAEHYFSIGAGYNYAKYPVKLVVTDTWTNATSETIIPTEVYRRDLQASIIAVDHKDVNAAVNFTIDPAYVDPGKYTIVWDFGDKQTAVGATVAHTFTRTGDYAVAARIYDKAEYAADPLNAQPKKIAMHPINIHSAGAPNLIGLIPSSASVKDTRVLLSASSKDNVSYSWEISYIDKNGLVQHPAARSDQQFYFDFSQVMADSEMEVTLTAIDGSGQKNKITRTLHVYPNAPLLSIGGDHTGYVGQEVDLRGISNTAAGLNYKWIILNQTTGTYEERAGELLAYTPSAEGTYTFRFVATDAANREFTRDQVVEVYKPSSSVRQPLAAISTPYSAKLGGKLTLSGQTDVANANISWRVILPSSSSALPLIITKTGNDQQIDLSGYPTATGGSGLIEMTVTDPITKQARVITQSLSLGLSTPLVSMSAPYSAKVGANYNFFAQVDALPAGAKYEFGYVDATGYHIVPDANNDGIPDLPIVFNAAGTYQVTVKIKDAGGNVLNQQTQNVSAGTDTPLLGIASALSGNRGQSFALVAQTDSSDPSLTYEWTVIDNIGSHTLTGQSTAYTFNAIGTYMVRCAIKKNGVTVNQLSQNVTIGGGDVPMAAIAANLDVVVNTTYAMAARTDAGATVSWTVQDFDGQKAPSGGNTATTSHVFTRNGTYMIKLVVTGTNGQQNTVTQFVTVHNA